MFQSSLFPKVAFSPCVTARSARTYSKWNKFVREYHGAESLKLLIWCRYNAGAILPGMEPRSWVRASQNKRLIELHLPIQTIHLHMLFLMGAIVIDKPDYSAFAHTTLQQVT